MKAIAFSTGQTFKFNDSEEVFEFHSVFFIENGCFVRYRKKTNPRVIHEKEVNGLWDLVHV